MAVKAGGKLPAAIVRGRGNLNLKEAAEHIGVKTRYLAMACWRPGGKRKRRHKNG